MMGNAYTHQMLTLTADDTHITFPGDLDDFSISIATIPTATAKTKATVWDVNWNYWAEKFYPAQSKYRVFNYDPNTIEGTLRLFNGGLFGIYDENCHFLFIVEGGSPLGMGNTAAYL